MTWEAQQAGRPGTIDPAQRRAILSRHVQMAIGRGGRVQSSDDYTAVIVYGKPVSHLLHAILTIFLLGLWLFIWIPLALLGGEKREMITVDDYGRVSTSKL